MAEYKLEANIRLWEGPPFTTKLQMTQYDVKSGVRLAAILQYERLNDTEVKFWIQVA